MFGGLLGVAVTFLCWSLVCAVTFEFCRVMQTFDYGSMMKHILGPCAFLYDLCYWIMFLIVMGVVNASAGAIIEKLGFDPREKVPEDPNKDEWVIDDSKPNPFSVLTREESKFLLDNDIL